MVAANCAFSTLYPAISNGLKHSPLSGESTKQLKLAAETVAEKEKHYEHLRRQHALLMTEADLNDAFSAFGTVNSARLVMDRDTGRAKGFGFVEMNDSAEAQKAIDGMNGTSHGGRALVVNEARPREERPSRGGFGGGNRRGGFRNSY